MLAGVLGQVAEGEGGAVREAEDAVKGTLRVDDVVEQVVRFLDGSVVRGRRGKSSGPAVVAVVGTFVDGFDAGARAAADFAAGVDEGCAMVFF